MPAKARWARRNWGVFIPFGLATASSLQVGAAVMELAFGRPLFLGAKLTLIRSIHFITYSLPCHPPHPILGFLPFLKTPLGSCLLLFPFSFLLYFQFVV
ncbi:hypothetical protein B0T10DRAFT_237177 [Thelonectria olida]|uniref:Uncharacterized protein n=1 Tax=Thelonectria olida TaxID=1576542 RepID=A0A9P8WA69_9HYPO|nr:hypothetical protein B0T10DRAFT_237177 [Thelonectria olida]